MIYAIYTLHDLTDMMQERMDESIDQLKKIIPDAQVVTCSRPEDAQFRRSSCINDAYREINPAPEDYLMFIDIDIFLQEGLFDSIGDHEIWSASAMMLNKEGNPDHPGKGIGTVFIKAEHFKNVNGFNEIFIGWGFEDSDFRDRLEHYSELEGVPYKQADDYHPHHKYHENYSRDKWTYGLRNEEIYNLMREQEEVLEEEELYRTSIGIESHLSPKDAVYRHLTSKKARTITKMNENLTAFIVSQDRPKSLIRLISSFPSLLDFQHREVPLIIGESGDELMDIGEFDNLRTITLPRKCGIGVGRMKLLDHIDTEYVLYLDDDYVFMNDTRIEKLYELLDNNPNELDIVGGNVIENGHHRHFEYKLKQTGELFEYIPVKQSWRQTYYPTDTVLNFWIGKTRVVKDIGFDHDLKKSTHTDFFWRAKKMGYKVGYRPDVVIRHLPGERLMSTDQRMSYYRMWMQKNGIKKVMQDGKEKYSI